DGRSTRGGGRKNGRSRGTAPRCGSHASTPIIRDSLTIGFPPAVTEIYRKPVHVVPATPLPTTLCRRSGSVSWRQGGNLRERFRDRGGALRWTGPSARGCSVSRLVEGLHQAPRERKVVVLGEGVEEAAREKEAKRDGTRESISAAAAAAAAATATTAAQTRRVSSSVLSRRCSIEIGAAFIVTREIGRSTSVDRFAVRKEEQPNSQSGVLSQGEDDVEPTKIRETRGRRASLNRDQRGEDKGEYLFKLWWPSFEWSRSCKTEARCQAASLERACWNAQERARTLWGLQQANRGFLLHPSSKSWLAETIIGADEARSSITTYFHSYPFVPGGAVPLPPPLLNGINNPAAAAITPGLVGHLFGAQQACNLACTCSCNIVANCNPHHQHHHQQQHQQHQQQQQQQQHHHRTLGTTAVLLQPVDHIKDTMLFAFPPRPTTNTRRSISSSFVPELPRLVEHVVKESHYRRRRRHPAASTAHTCGRARALCAFNWRTCNLMPLANPPIGAVMPHEMENQFGGSSRFQGRLSPCSSNSCDVRFLLVHEHGDLGESITGRGCLDLLLGART
ncbi:hypothetical protein X777_15837, partial [Ooceraea biroi]